MRRESVVGEGMAVAVASVGSNGAAHPRGKPSRVIPAAQDNHPLHGGGGTKERRAQTRGGGSEGRHPDATGMASKYFPPTTFRRLVAHTRLTFIFLQSGISAAHLHPATRFHKTRWKTQTQTTRLSAWRSSWLGAACAVAEKQRRSFPEAW